MHALLKKKAVSHPTCRLHVCSSLTVKVFFAILKLKSMFRKSGKIVVEVPLLLIAAKVSNIFH